MFLPEGFERGGAAAKDVALGLPDVGHAFRVGSARKIANAVAGVLPHGPTVPRSSVPWLEMVVGNPEPAITESLSLRCGDPRAIEHLSKAIFTAVETRISAGPLMDPFDEGDGLVDPHRPARIMPVLLEVQDEQDSIRVKRGSTPLRHNGIQKKLGLADGIRRIGKMIGSPEQAGPSRRILSSAIIRIAHITGIRGFMNDGEDAFSLHLFEVRTHEVVVR